VGYADEIAGIGSKRWAEGQHFIREVWSKSRGRKVRGEGILRFITEEVQARRV
jgi:hypothetical protein